MAQGITGSPRVYARTRSYGLWPIGWVAAPRKDESMRFQPQWFSGVAPERQIAVSADRLAAINRELTAAVETSIGAEGRECRSRAR